MRIARIAFALPLAACGGDPPSVGAPALVVVPPAPASGAWSAPAASPATAPVMVDAVPPDAHPIDVNFENKIHLVAYRFDPTVAAPGTPVKIIFFWRCDAAVEDGWQLFTHISDDTTSKVANLDGTPGSLREMRDGRQRLGPDRWEAGKLYVDDQLYTVPVDTQGTASSGQSGGCGCRTRPPPQRGASRPPGSPCTLHASCQMFAESRVHSGPPRSTADHLQVRAVARKRAETPTFDQRPVADS